MKPRRLVSWFAAGLCFSLGGGGRIAAGAAEPPAPVPPASTKPINLSRVLGGATIQLLDPKTGQPSAVSGLSAAIDDNTSSGWSPPVGSSVLLIAFPGDATIGSFSLFAPGMKGRYKVSAASSLEAAVNPKARTPLLSSTFGDDEDGQPIAEAKAKYLVIELDVTESAPLRSIDTVGRPAIATTGQKLVVTPESGEQNAGTEKGQVAEVNFAATELGAKVVTGGQSYDKLIDGDTGTAGQLTVTDGKSATVVIDLAAAVDIDRITLAFAEAKGKVSFWSTDSPPPDGRLLGETTLDGTGRTLTIETAGISARSLTIVWTPEDGHSALMVNEVGVFALARVLRQVPSLPFSQPSGNEPVAPPPPPPSTVPPPPPPVLPPSKPVSG